MRSFVWMVSLKGADMLPLRGARGSPTGRVPVCPVLGFAVDSVFSIGTFADIREPITVLGIMAAGMELAAT